MLDLIRERRSIAPKRLIPPGPEGEELNAIVAAALTAPDHCALRPWRFVRVTDEQRVALGDLFAREKVMHEPGATESEIEKERGRAHNAPALIAVLLERMDDHPTTPVSEQLVSLGAAVQNILLAAHARGYGAMMTSGRKVRSGIVRDAFCRRPNQQLVGFISIGTPSGPPRPRREAALDEHFTVWEPRP